MTNQSQARSLLAIIALIIGLFTLAASIVFVAISDEAQRRIARSLEIIDSEPPTYGEGLTQAMQWQVSSVLSGLAMIVGSAVGICLGVVALRHSNRLDGWSLAAVCMNVVGLCLNVFVVWGIS